MAPSPPFVELHAHSGYSFLDGASHPEELVLAARELGYPALALTDHDGLYGAMEFARAAREADLQPITGAEITVRDCGLPLPKERPTANGRPLPPAAASSRPDEPAGCFHLTLLVETPEGYANLCRLITCAHRAGPRGSPALPLPLLLEHAEGLILLTGCRRSPLLHALEHATETGEAFARRLVRAFGPDRVFVELQENRVRGDAGRGRRLGRLADRMGLPVVATGNVHYHRRERHRLQDVLVALRHRTPLDGSHPQRRPCAEFHLASPEEMGHRFASRPDAISNTLRIAERCAAFDLTRDLGYRFPDFAGSGNGSAMETLTTVTHAALTERYPVGDAATRTRRAEAERRLEEELALVARHGLGGFFLVYRDIMALAREVAHRVRGDAPRATSGLPPGRGRGSSVSSIICYLIGLSHVDPVDANLFLGRFLNEAMGSVPDIDLDFPRDIREALILEVYRRYGDDHAGLVAIFPTYRLRSAVREVGKALDLPPGDLAKIAKLAEHRSAGGLREDLAALPEFRERMGSPPWTHFLERVEEIAGLPRHISQHVGGMIISSRPLLELVPLEPAAMDGRILCQWDKDSCNDAGFIKIDFLALGMLSLVEEAVDLIAERGTARRPPGETGIGARPFPLAGDAPDLSRIDLADPEVYRRIQEGDTVGIFQVESRAQIQMLRRTRPSNLEELAVQVAIVRPGPIVGGAVNPYVRRREAQRADPTTRIPFDHPLLEPALSETLGVIIYQDQVLQVCRDLAGFSDGRAESLRRAMSRKRSKEAMREHWEAFREGARRRGVDEETARSVFRQVVAFSEFGFPKSHAAAFALLAYQSAWLRHHFPTEYYVALFNNQPMGFYGLDALGRDARRNGIQLRLPDVNRSHVRCTAEGNDLRVGLGFVREWGEAMAARVVEERERAGPYRSLVDFLRRTPAALRRPAVENLIWVGGLDGLGLTRRELLWQTGLWLGPEEERVRAGGRADDPQVPMELADPEAGRAFRDLEGQDRMAAEYRMLHFSTEHHPVEWLRPSLPRDTLGSDRLATLPQGARVTLAGIVIARQRPMTAKGYVFVLMEDEFGHMNVIVKPRVYERCRTAVRMEPFLLVRGALQRDGTALNVIAREIVPLSGDAGGRGRPTPDSRASSRGSKTHEGGPPSSTADPLSLLTTLRQNPPGIKSFG